MRIYSDPTRTNDKWSLPDVEIIYLDRDDKNEEGEPYERGYYYQYGFPGCLSDSEPFGPYASEEEAIKSCQEYSS